MKQRVHLNNMDEFQVLLKQHDILRQFSLSRIAVFGSFARDESAKDIDLFIEDDLSLETALKLRNRLEALMDNPLDIMLKRWANPIVLHRAAKDMRYVEG